MQRARGQRGRAGRGRGSRGRGRGIANECLDVSWSDVSLMTDTSEMDAIDNDDHGDDLCITLPDGYKRPKSRKRTRQQRGGDGAMGLAERVVDAMDVMSNQYRYASARSTSTSTVDMPAQSASVDSHVCWQNYSGIVAELGSHTRYDPSVHNGWTPITSAWFAPSLVKEIPTEYNNGCYWKMCTENGQTSHMVLGDGKVCLDVPLSDESGNWIRRDLCTHCWTYTNQHVMDKRPRSPLEFVLMCNKCAATASASGFSTALAFAKRQRRKYTPNSKAPKCEYALAGDNEADAVKKRKAADGQQDILVMFQKRTPKKT